MTENKKTVGFTMVENDLLKMLCSSSLSSSQVRIILFIIYQTIGYHREEKMLTINYISKGTGIPYSTVRHSLTGLKNKRIIHISYNERMYRIIKINKNYCQWDVGNKETVFQISDNTKNRQSDKPFSNSLSNNFQTEGQTTKGQGGIQPTDANKIKKKTIKINTKKSSSKTTPAPTMNEVISFCKNKGYSFSGEKFFYHYQSLGWTYNGQPIADWKALADKWQTTEKRYGQTWQNISTQSNSQAQSARLCGNSPDGSTAKATAGSGDSGRASYDLEAYEKFSMFDD